MHVGGALANDDVRGDEPSAFGHGVSPVTLAPAGTGAALGTPPAAAVVVDPPAVVVVSPGAVVVEDEATDDLSSPPRLSRKAISRTTAARTAPTMMRRWFRRRFCAPCNSCCLYWRPSRWR